MPIRYVNQSFPHRLLTGYYRTARIGLVTPLRDGMNLVAKEYVASQDPKIPACWSCRALPARQRN